VYNYSSNIEGYRIKHKLMTQTDRVKPDSNTLIMITILLSGRLFKTIRIKLCIVELYAGSVASE